MKKEKFETLKLNNKFKWILGITFGILLIVSISLLKSHAGYILTTSVKVGTGTVDYSTSDAYLVGLYVPNSDNTGYDLITDVPVGAYVINETESYCTTDGTSDRASKDSTIKMVYTGGIIEIKAAKKKTKCWVYLDKPTVAAATGLASTIIAKSSTSSQIEVINHEFDGLTDYRYVGASPDNYICFGTNDKATCLSDTNTYLYRIIGVMPTQTEVGGSYEYRVKLIKDTISSILYYWTGQTTGGTENYSSYSGLGSNYNNWEENRLNKVILNGKFLADLGDWGQKIGTAVWYLGGTYTSSIKTEAMYEYERGTTVYSGNPTAMVAKVGLMYPSDYGYAAGNTCSSETNLYNYDYGCESSDYLFKSATEWLITPRSDNAYDAFYVYGLGGVNYYYNNDVYSRQFVVRQSFYLKSSVSLLAGSEGTGNSSNPYLLN